MLIKFQNWTPEIGKNTWIAQSADVIGEVETGEDVSIWFGCVVRGDVHYIKIGDRVSIQDLSMVHVTHYKKEDKRQNYNNSTQNLNKITKKPKDKKDNIIIADSKPMSLEDIKKEEKKRKLNDIIIV